MYKHFFLLNFHCLAYSALFDDQRGISISDERKHLLVGNKQDARSKKTFAKTMFLQTHGNQMEMSDYLNHRNSEEQTMQCGRWNSRQLNKVEPRYEAEKLIKTSHATQILEYRNKNEQHFLQWITPLNQCPKLKRDRGQSDEKMQKCKTFFKDIFAIAHSS